MSVFGLEGSFSILHLIAPTYLNGDGAYSVLPAYRMFATYRALTDATLIKLIKKRSRV